MTRARILTPAGLRGFTLLEALIAMTIVGILAAIAFPSYTAQVVNSRRSAAQQELLDVAALQERIYLNSNAYATSIDDDYTGQADGGLGKTGSVTSDGRYTLSMNVPAGDQSFTLTATPVTGSSQEDDGALTINSSGRRTWGSKTW